MKPDAATLEAAARMVALYFDGSKPHGITIHGIHHATELEACQALQLEPASFRAMLATRIAEQSAWKFKPRHAGQMTVGELIGRPALGNRRRAVMAFIEGRHDREGIEARHRADWLKVKAQNNRSEARRGRPYKGLEIAMLLAVKSDYEGENGRPRGWQASAAKQFEVSERTIRRMMRAAR